jgi:hypothetical protein
MKSLAGKYGTHGEVENDIIWGRTYGGKLTHTKQKNHMKEKQNQMKSNVTGFYIFYLMAGTFVTV